VDAGDGRRRWRCRGSSGLMWGLTKRYIVGLRAFRALLYCLWADFIW
jgi:hypothetical protein